MSRRTPILVLAAGLVLMALARVAMPLGSPPLYDGVVVQDSYRYLEPGPGQQGSPTSFHATVPAQSASGLLFSAATTENPPQAQLIAGPGTFDVPPGTTSLAVSIEPVPRPTADAGSGRIVGNVYRFTVTDPSGHPVPVSASNAPSLILRAPDGTSSATIAHLVGAAWQELPTQPAGQPGILLANVNSLGEFTLLAPRPGPLGLDSTMVFWIIAAAALAAGVGAALLVRRRRRPAAAPEPPAPGRTVVSKRRRDRRRGRPR